jgi:hypothetical protein
VLTKDLSAEVVRFAECNGSHPGSLEAETESTNSTEEVEDIHHLYRVGLRGRLT